MCSKMMLDISQQARRFVTGGLNYPACELSQGGLHQRIPSGLITGLSQFFQNDEVAHRLRSHQAQTAGKRFVLGEGDVFEGHIFGQARGFGVVVGDDGGFNLAVDLLLGSIGGGDKSIEPSEFQEEADQANPTRPNFNADEMKGQNHPVQEREPQLTLEKRGDMGANVEGIVPLAPGLKGGAGNLKPFGGLTLGDTLNLQL